jgi:hypothetical protein
MICAKETLTSPDTFPVTTGPTLIGDAETMTEPHVAARLCDKRASGLFELSVSKGFLLHALIPQESERLLDPKQGREMLFCATWAYSKEYRVACIVKPR